MSFDETTPEQRSRPSMRWWGWLLSAALIVGVVGSLVFPTRAPIQGAGVGLSTTAGTSPPWSNSIVENSVDAFLNAYNNSIPKAIVMYNGQTLRSVGFLAGFGQDGDVFYADLAPSAGSVEAGETLRFYFRDEISFAPVRELPKGSEVRITGFCTVSPDAGIHFTDCSDVYASY